MPYRPPNLQKRTRRLTSNYTPAEVEAVNEAAQAAGYDDLGQWQRVCCIEAVKRWRALRPPPLAAPSHPQPTTGAATTAP